MTPAEWVLLSLLRNTIAKTGITLLTFPFFGPKIGDSGKYILK
jgi:hypothetical protein